MSDAGQELLDSALWAVESVALLPETDLDALSVVTFMLSPGLQEQADALATNPSAHGMAAFLAEAVDLDVELGSTWLLNSESWPGGIKELGMAYADLSGLSIDAMDFADLLAELRIPIFESQSKTSETIEKWGGRAGTVVSTVGTASALGAAAGVGGHVGAVIALIAPPLGIAIVIGTYGTVGGIALAGYLKRRKREKEERLAAEEAEQEAARKATAEREAAEAQAAFDKGYRDEQAAFEADLKEAEKRLSNPGWASPN